MSVCSSPTVPVRACTDGHQEGQFVYCFRPRGMSAVTAGLGRGFPQARVFQRPDKTQSVRSLASVSNQTLITLDQKQRALTA